MGDKNAVAKKIRWSFPRIVVLYASNRKHSAESTKVVESSRDNPIHFISEYYGRRNCSQIKRGARDLIPRLSKPKGCRGIGSRRDGGPFPGPIGSR